MISYNASVAKICVLFELNDRQWSSKKSRSLIYVFYLFSMIVNDLLQCLDLPNMYLLYTLWSSMISYIASVAQQMFLFGHYDRQWFITKPRSPKNVSCLISMIVNYLLEDLGRSKCLLFCFLWSSLLSFNASCAEKCVLFELYDDEWSLT